ncbi:MAG TPA: hypothetical protein VME17_04620 [Bryobacteraceae bacterium]|nr:hypothetical protein [Bryobacteraceae bacterium]
MQNVTTDTCVEADVRFQGYRLEVVSTWPASPRKVAAAAAIAQRLAAIARSALVRPDIADLLHLSCQLLDNFFVSEHRALPQFPSTENASSTLPGIPPFVA